MRPTSVVLCLLASLAAAGCTSSSTDALLAPAPSLETTASIKRPQVDIAALIDSDGAVLEQALPRSAAPPARPDDPPVKEVALLAPDKPDKIAKAFRRGIIYRHRFRDAHPINFGKSSPKQLAVHGVDVSRWQGNIDWPKLLNQGANFVYIKATDGGDHLDPMFRKNWREAEQAGLRRGAYHFFYWCRTASEQADWFIRNVPRVAGALPPVIDVEYNAESRCKRRLSRTTVLEKMKVFMDRLEAHYAQRPIIYTAPDFYADNLEGEFLNHPFWLRSVAAHPSKRYPGRKWVFWQYSGSGLSHGVSGKIDLNVFHGNESQWRRWLAGNAG